MLYNNSFVENYLLEYVRSDSMNLFYSWLMAFVILYTKTEANKYASVYISFLDLATEFAG